MNLLPLKQRRSALFTLVSVLAAAYAAPYLVPDSPDSLVFRDGILPALLLLAAAYPARAAFEKHPARALKYGGFLALVFSFFLGLGSELMVYDGFLPGAGSFIRRLAVPCLMTPLLGALFSYLFAAPARNDAPACLFRSIFWSLRSPIRRRCWPSSPASSTMISRAKSYSI